MSTAGCFTDATVKCSGALLYVSMQRKHMTADLKNSFRKFQGFYQNSNTFIYLFIFTLGGAEMWEEVWRFLASFPFSEKEEHLEKDK